jgi:hypothetical protein
MPGSQLLWIAVNQVLAGGITTMAGVDKFLFWMKT